MVMSSLPFRSIERDTQMRGPPSRKGFAGVRSSADHLCRELPHSGFELRQPGLLERKVPAVLQRDDALGSWSIFSSRACE
jgi:hypothetical protein